MLGADSPLPGPPADRLSTPGRSGSGSILAQPFRIGGVECPNRVVLAPMAGLTSSAYRRHLKDYGVGLVITEMVSVYGLIYGNVRTGGYLDFREEERPIGVQLFGHEPEAMARATEIVLSRPKIPDLIDINMGCPVRKVTKTGAGVALMADAERAVAIAAAVVEVANSLTTGAGERSPVPVTVKLRAGLTPGDGLAVALAPRLQAAGVSALGVHPRSASEYYHGRADHRVTTAVVDSVDIPVMASGDIDSVEAALAVMQTTGSAAVMLARGVGGDPWLVDVLLSGRPAPRPPLAVVVADLRVLLRRAEEEMGADRAVRWIRKALTWYLKPSGVSPRALERLSVIADIGLLDDSLAALAGSEQGSAKPAEPVSQSE